MSLTRPYCLLLAAIFLAFYAPGPGLFGVAQAETGRLSDGERRLRLLPPLVGLSPQTPTHALSGLALDGFDPVSYFLADAPRPGRPRNETIWGGAVWRFASAANRAAFLAAPEVYAPRLGGNDALAMSEGRTVEASARIAAVVGDRLYLFVSDAARRMFLEDPLAAARAEAEWLQARTRLARE